VGVAAAEDHCSVVQRAVAAGAGLPEAVAAVQRAAGVSGAAAAAFDVDFDVDADADAVGAFPQTGGKVVAGFPCWVAAGVLLLPDGDGEAAAGCESAGEEVPRGQSSLHQRDGFGRDDGCCCCCCCCCCRSRCIIILVVAQINNPVDEPVGESESFFVVARERESKLPRQGRGHDREIRDVIDQRLVKDQGSVQILDGIVYAGTGQRISWRRIRSRRRCRCR